MMMAISLIVSAFALLPLFAGAFEVTSTTNSLVSSSDSAEYSCILTNLWSSATHPVGYPGNSAHWTSPVLAAHSSSYTMWASGGIATAGVENVAELGITSTLRGELQTSNGVGNFVIGNDQFNNRDPPQTLPSIQVDATHRLLSVITMVAPSPDWFSGFYNFDAVNPSTNSWYREFTIDSFPWDAGTEEGTSFSLGNPETNPREQIREYTVDTVPANGVFLNGARNTVLPMATWTCSLETPDPEPPADPFTVVRKTDSKVVAAQPGQVDYVCEFQNQWSAARHPALYPGGGAHWSPPVLASHSSSYTMWEEGGMASPGVESVAETGSTNTLQSELNSESAVHDSVQGILLFNNEQQRQTFEKIQLTKTSRFLSTISMIAPSPDWMSGFYNFDAVNPANNVWYREFVIETYPWDAGTEDGDTYSPDNPASSPAQPISRFSPSNLPSTNVFLSSNGREVLPVATWTCTLQQNDPFLAGCFSGRTTVEVQDKGVILMQDLKVGDMVKVDNSNNFDRVYAFGHYSNTLTTSYLKIHTEAMKNKPLEITKDHMLFVESKSGEQKAVPASMIKIGDLLVMEGEESVAQVTKITSVSRSGAYAPFTMSGTIVVNSVVASSYVSLQEDADQVMLRGGISSGLGHHVMAHVATTPLRLLSRSGLFFSAAYGDDGVAAWIQAPHSVAKSLMRPASNPALLAIALAAMAVIAVPLYLAELLLFKHPDGALAAAAAILLVGTLWQLRSVKRGGTKATL